MDDEELESGSEEGFDPGLLHQDKYCPKCYTDDLVRVQLDPAEAIAFECTSCHGIWVMNPGSLEVPSVAPAVMPPHDRENDLRAGLCPFAHGILRRAQSYTEERFYLERCGACSGVWFDRGEWERAAAAGLLRDVHVVWTESWQMGKLEEERRARLLAQAKDVLGDDLVTDLRRIGRRLRNVEERNQGVALLLEVIRGNLD